MCGKSAGHGSQGGTEHLSLMREDLPVSRRRTRQPAEGDPLIRVLAQQGAC